MGTGCYLYRPPGILHGPASAPSDNGATILQRMNGEVRILRYDGDEFPHEHLQAITDEYKTWPVEWNEHLDVSAMPWEPVTSGPWTGTSFKTVHRNKVTGGGAVLLNIPGGWRGEGSRVRATVEEFVVHGEYTAGAEHYGKWGYSYDPLERRPASTPQKAGRSCSAGGMRTRWSDPGPPAGGGCGFET